MKRVTLSLTVALVALLAFLPLATPGCAALRPGQDPVAVNLERGYTISFDSVNAFLTIEDANRAMVKKKLPAVHAAAEQMRKTGKPTLQFARDSIRAYESVKTADSAKTATGALAALEAMASQAAAFTSQIHSAGGT